MVRRKPISLPATNLCIYISFRSFRWKFNNSGETLDIGKERHYRNGSTSVLQYTPITDQVSVLSF